MVIFSTFGIMCTQLGETQKSMAQSLAATVEYQNTINESLNATRDSILLVIHQKQMMSTMAYHQAIAEMQLKYPYEDRNNIPNDEWISLVEERQEEILENASRDIRQSLENHIYQRE